MDDAAADRPPNRQPGAPPTGEALPPAAPDPEAGEGEVRRFPDGSREVRPDSEKYTGQAPPEDLDEGDGVA